jgi:hypothetical protein
LRPLARSKKTDNFAVAAHRSMTATPPGTCPPRPGGAAPQEEKEVKTAIAAMVLATVSIASASAQERNPTQEYRMWSAEQMINRIAEKYVRMNNLCDRTMMKRAGLSEECKTTVAKAYPILTTIREVALSGDTVRWAELIDIIHTMERELEGPLKAMERTK